MSLISESVCGRKEPGTHKKTGIIKWSGTYNVGTWEVEAEGSEIQGQFHLHQILSQARLHKILSPKS